MNNGSGVSQRKDPTILGVLRGKYVKDDSEYDGDNDYEYHKISRSDEINDGRLVYEDGDVEVQRTQEKRIRGR